MVERLKIEDFLTMARDRVILDVRTPSEFEQGHIPGASNFPLFSDEERVEIGTLYKQVSRDTAFHRGLELIGPRMASMVEKAALLAPEQDVLIHCWRGGQRSDSVGWLLNAAGFKVAVLEGGYKAYRRFVLDSFELMGIKLLVLGGPTGSGKTELLWHMEELGAQVVDLEKLANHKGSAFGSLGEEDQPSTEHFENELNRQFRTLDPARPVWVEHESRGIGRVFLPDPFWRYLMKSNLVLIDTGRDARLKHAVEVYGSFDVPLIKSCFMRISNRMGGQHVKAAVEAIDAGDMKTAASIALDYYDKAYAHHLEKYPHPAVHRISIEGLSREAAAQKLVELENSFLQ
ncbi:MAG: tRNA 2-selenouridine(34) synthase MnmH [Saprospirales bacterium]|nr:tRNA 2-selenouridine(34) synthase MnmH [Saprospirales bacterium]